MRPQPFVETRILPGLLASAVALALAPAPALAVLGPGLRQDPDKRIFRQWPAPAAARPQGVTATRVVSNCDDAGPGSLRDVVAGASDGDTIDLSQLPCSAISLTSGVVVVPVPNLTLDGPGRNRLRIDANGHSRVLIHPFGGTLVVSDITIADGADIVTGLNVSGGGCIASAGYLILRNATVRDCLASGEAAYGGGLYAGVLTMDHATLAGNTALGANDLASTAGWGGGAFVYHLEMVDSVISGNRASNDPNDGYTSVDFGGGALVIHGARVTRSAIVGNYSYGRGGGLGNLTGTVEVTNSTISGNRAAHGAGGGLFLRRPTELVLNSATVAANRAEAGGGVALYVDASVMTSSIVAGNQANAGVADIVSTNALVLAGDHNLIGEASANITLPGDTLSSNPGLAPLAFNGGVTPTHALLPGSAALDAGSNPLGLVTDQRGPGFEREFGAAIDIGAIEYQPVAQATPVALPAGSPWAAAVLAALLAWLGIRNPRPARSAVRQRR